MTGHDVLATRRWLDWSARQGARVLGVSSSTWFRWEKRKGSPIPFENTLSRRLMERLCLLRLHLAGGPDEGPAVYGLRKAEGEGPTAALRRLTELLQQHAIPELDGEPLIPGETDDNA